MFGYRLSYILLRPWKIVFYSYRAVKHFIQRGLRGYSDQDAWSLDSYLLSWLPEAILSMGNHGYPTDVKNYKAWQKIKEEMAVGLIHARKIQDFEFKNKKELNQWQKKADKGLDLFRKHFYSLWD